MSFLSSFLQPEKGYKAGQNQLDKYFNQAQTSMQPFVQQGQQQYGNIKNSINALLDPQALQDKWSSGYQESQAAKDSQGMAQQQGLDAASSMGLMGSNTALNAVQAGTAQIGAQDRQTYLDNLMQKYLAGTGMAQNVYGQGATAAGQMAQNSMNMGQNSAQMSYGQQNAPGQLFGNLLNTGANVAGSWLLGGK